MSQESEASRVQREQDVKIKNLEYEVANVDMASEDDDDDVGFLYSEAEVQENNAKFGRKLLELEERLQAQVSLRSYLRSLVLDYVLLYSLA